MLRVFSMHTNDLYKEQAEQMAASARFYGLATELFERPDLGSWWQNCNQKSQLVLEMITKYPDEISVWVDADCRFVDKPNLFYEIGDFDIAMFFANQTYFSSAVLWLNGKRALPYVEGWCDNVEANPTLEDDMHNFRASVQEQTHRGVFHLPPAYCWAKREMRSKFPGAKPVIVHAMVGTHNYPVR